jgi:hypothetical protein
MSDMYVVGTSVVKEFNTLNKDGAADFDDLGGPGSPVIGIDRDGVPIDPTVVANVASISNLGVGRQRIVISTGAPHQADFTSGSIYTVYIVSGTIGGEDAAEDKIFDFRLGNASSETSIYNLVQKIWNKVAAIGVASFMSLTARRVGPTEVTIGDTFDATTGQRFKFLFVGYTSIEGMTITGQLRYKNGDKISDLSGAIGTFSANAGDTQEAFIDILPTDYNDGWTPSREGVEHEMLCQVDYGGGKIATVGRAGIVLLRG